MEDGAAVAQVRVVRANGRVRVRGECAITEDGAAVAQVRCLCSRLPSFTLRATTFTPIYDHCYSYSDHLYSYI